MSSRPARAVPFIELNGDSFHVTEEGRQFLMDVKGPIATVAVVGKYRTGKSFLMNRILLNRGDGFTVGPTVNACTKGLWIWTEPIESDRPDGKHVNVLVIDSEGIGALSADATHDTRIFTLALLLSSLFVFNSSGAIDESALSNLSLVVNLTKHIQTKSGARGEDDGSDFSTYFPEFLWVVRDFSLQLKDPSGRPITSREYFEAALQQQKGASEAIEQKNRIRRLLCEFFQQRDCCTMVRPVTNEELLQNLDQVPVDQLRPEFVTEMKNLRGRILGQSPIKTLNGKELDGPALLSLAESYSHAINSGSVPNIGEAWDSLCLNQNIRRMEAVVAGFKTAQVPLLHALIPCAPADLRSQHDAAAAKANAELQKDLFGDVGVLEEYRVKLAEALGALLDGLLAENERVGEEKCLQLLRELYAPVEIKLKENAFASFNEYEQNRRAVTQTYKDKAPKVNRREEILLQFIVESLASASQMLYNKIGRELEQTVSLHKETMEVERRKATEMRMGLERDRDVARANLDSLTSNLADAKSREESARKSVEHLEASLRSEKEEFKQRQKDLEASNKDMQASVRTAETKIILLESEKEKFSELNKQSVGILEDKLKVASESESRARAELAAEKKGSEEKLAEARSQARSELSDRDSRLKDITQQLDQARADVFAAKNEAESFRQANARLQVELDSGAVSSNEKLAAAAAAAAADREQLRLQIESLDVKLKEQDAELRAAVSKEKESLQQTKKQLQDAKSESLQLGMERDSLQKQLDVQQKQHQQFLDTFKATKEDESSSRTLLTESTSRHEATLARLMKDQESERASLSARAEKLQKQYDDVLQAKRDVEQQLQERELELRKAARERDDTRQELSKAQQAFEQMKTTTVDISVHQRLLDQVKEERAGYASRIDETTRSYKEELAGRQRQWDSRESDLKEKVEELQTEVAEWKAELEEEVGRHDETVRKLESEKRKLDDTKERLQRAEAERDANSRTCAELNEKLAVTREEKIEEIARITRDMDSQRHALQTEAMSATSKAELDLSKERLTTKHMREEIDRLEKEQRETKLTCDERVDTLHKSALERVESIQKQPDSVRTDALESERKLRDDKLDLQKEMSALKVQLEQSSGGARNLEEKLKAAAARAEEELRAKTADLMRDVAAERQAVKAAEARRQEAEQRAAAAAEAEQKVLEELAEAKLHSTRELQAARTDLKNAQEEFNSARQMGLQRQNELQSEMNQLKMSYEMREKDVDRLNQTLSADKAQKDAKLQDLQQQLEDTMNELESLKSLKLRSEIDCKSMESEKRTLGERLQLAIKEAERYKDAVSNLETQAKLAESQIQSIKNQLEQKTIQLEEAQARKNELISSSQRQMEEGDGVRRTTSAGPALQRTSSVREQAAALRAKRGSVSGGPDDFAGLRQAESPN